MIKPRLLVVEDDESSRKGWHSLFSRRGWDVVAAGTVAEGLALLEPAPDYLILDLSLPDGDGSTVLRKVRETNLQTRVVVTTGYSDTERLRVVNELNPAAVLEKPIDVGDVWREGELAMTV